MIPNTLGAWRRWPGVISPNAVYGPRVAEVRHGDYTSNWVAPVFLGLDLAPSARSNPTAFEAVRFQPPDRHENGGDGGIRHSAHAVFDLKYHLIWCTKYRHKALRGRIAERARDLIRQICQAREVVIVRGAISPDHIHMLVAAPPIVAPAKLAQYIKGRSSRHLQAEFAELRKQYWGQHMWARGYFCATVGAVDEATIKAYIGDQKWDEGDDAFRITAPTKP